MGALPDWMIRRLCEDGNWAAHWRRPNRGGEGASRARDRGAVMTSGEWTEWYHGEDAWKESEYWESIPNAGPLITPFDPLILGPSSVDMRMGTSFQSPEELTAHVTQDGNEVSRINYEHFEHGSNGAWRLDGERVLKYFRAYHKIPANGVQVNLRPGQALACISAEYYRLPPDLQGKLYTKSSLAREWIDHSTATKIHPGFQGEITFEINNLGANPYAIKSGARIIHIEFEKMEAIPERPYFDLPQAKYRGQVGVLASVGLEKEV